MIEAKASLHFTETSLRFDLGPSGHIDLYLDQHHGLRHTSVLWPLESQTRVQINQMLSFKISILSMLAQVVIFISRKVCPTKNGMYGAGRFLELKLKWLVPTE